jgi:hypothetical protein
MPNYLETATEAPVYPWDCGIERLYHYEKFHAEYLASLLRDQRIRCSNPASLNDPWDCRPWFNTNGISDASIRKEMIAWFLMLNSGGRRSAGVDDSGVRIDEEHLNNVERALERNPEILEKVTNNASKNVFQMFGMHWHIYCLTPLPCSTLMWSHYADNHRGICLEFATNNDLFQCAQSVVYLSEYPVWYPHTLLETSIEEALLTKSED